MLFGGDCDAMLRATDVSAAVGQTMTRTTDAWSFGMLEQVGGLHCTWIAEGHPMAVSAAAAPASAVPADIHDVSECDERFCRATAVVDGVWVGAEALAADGGDPGKTANGMLATMVTTASGQTTSRNRVAIEGRWESVPDCETIVAGLDAEDGGLDRPITLDAVFSPGDSIVGRIESELGLRMCSLQVWMTVAGGPVQRGVTLVVAPGGAIAFERALEAGNGASEPADFGEVAVVNAPTHYENYPGVLGNDSANLLYLNPGGPDPKPLVPVLSQIFALIGG